MSFTMDTADISKTLYKINANGKQQQWKVYIEERNGKVYIMKEYGQVNGKLQIREKEVTIAKSKDTLNKQAIFQATRDWLDQVIKKQYSVEKQSSTPNKKQKKQAIFTPMLAQTYKTDKGFTTPCAIQPKLDGVRAYFENGKFKSRNHKEYFNMNHLTKDLKKIKENVIFDGELYNHNMTFQELMKYVKLKEINTDEDKKLPEIKKYVEYHIFDCYFPNNPKMPFSKRYDYLKSLEPSFKKSKICIVKLLSMSSIDELEGLHDEIASDGYEGVMLRSLEAPYEFKRSKYLQKYKVFVDEEFEVIGYDKEIQDGTNLVVWKCKTKEGKEFNCRPKGTHEEREDYYKNADSYLGKFLTVVFQEYTDDGLPRFPVGKGFRDDI